MTENKILEMFETEGEEIKHLSKTIDLNSFKKLQQMIMKCSGNVFVTGCGTSAMAAKKIVHTLRVIDIPAFYLNPSDAVHGALGSVHQKDLIIFISKGGNTKELTNFIPNLIEKKIKIIVVTESEKSELSKKSNLVVRIKISKELDEFNMLATTSTLAVISFFDVLAVCLMQTQKFTKTEFLINHPSGEVGERLKEIENEK